MWVLPLIGDEFPMITRPYTRPNGRKPCPFQRHIPVYQIYGSTPSPPAGDKIRQLYLSTVVTSKSEYFTNFVFRVSRAYMHLQNSNNYKNLKVRYNIVLLYNSNSTKLLFICWRRCFLIYIYMERERERERQTDRQTDRDRQRQRQRQRQWTVNSELYLNTGFYQFTLVFIKTV